jgi:NAD-dependent dihydropyrimidine dehydrogenase PreA subunit
MALRQIITIDEELCDGCGNCVTTCAEGALQLVDGKARLVKEMYCDGFGDCIDDCPTDALVIEEREAEPFDFEATRAYVAETGGAEALHRFDEAAAEHERKHGPSAAPPAPLQQLQGLRPPPGGGCPGSRMRVDASGPAREPVQAGGPKQAIPSELRQWPVQIHLVPPDAPFFRDKELVIMNTCGPLASADVHWRFLRGRGVVVGCPKLDDTRPYAQKLGAILSNPSIPKVTVVRMEVPCCGGLTTIAREAVALSGRSDLAFEEVTLGVGGDMLGVQGD